MEIHLLTPQGDLLVAQVVDGQVIVPPDLAPQTEKSASFEGRQKQTVPQDCGAKSTLKTAWLTHFYMSLEG